MNQVKTCGETIIEQYNIAKILRSLTPRFENVVVAIKESKDLATMSKDELQSSLEDHEKRMEERNNDKANAEITLQACFNEKDKRLKEKWPITSKGNFQNFGGREYQNSKNSTYQMGESSCKKMMVKAMLEVKRRGFLKARSNALGVKGLIILQKSAIRTRRNLKEMKLRLKGKSLMKRTQSWS